MTGGAGGAGAGGAGAGGAGAGGAGAGGAGAGGAGAGGAGAGGAGAGGAGAGGAGAGGAGAGGTITDATEGNDSTAAVAAAAATPATDATAANAASDATVVSTVALIAGRVARDYLGLRPGERFAIVVDDRTDPEIPAELARAALALGADPVVVSFAPRAGSGAEPPAPAAAAMATADVVLCAASTSLYHTTAKAAAQRAGARGDFNAPSRADAWRAGAMTADFFAIRARAERLAELWRRTREVRITSPAGTDLRATCEGRAPMAWLTGICRNPGEVSALPGGEVSLPPVEGTSEGIVVWERVASDLGALDGPVRITVRAGRAVSIEGGASADRLRAIVESVVDADNIGEIGIGLNPAARIGDQITEAKKAFGTVHIALGDSANEYGGLVECDVHLDGLVMEPTVEFDGVPVVVAGRHVYELVP